MALRALLSALAVAGVGLAALTGSGDARPARGAAARPADPVAGVDAARPRPPAPRRLAAVVDARAPRAASRRRRKARPPAPGRRRAGTGPDARPAAGDPPGAVEEKIRRLETLARLGREFSATLAVDRLQQRVVDAAVGLLGPDAAALWLLDDDTTHLGLAATAGLPETPQWLGRIPVGRGLVGSIVRDRTGLSVADVASDPRTQSIEGLRAVGVASIAGVPLLVGDRVLGVLAIATRAPHAYTGEEVGLLQSLGNQAAIAIDNARRLAEEQTRRAHLAALLEINAKIGAMAPTEPLLTSIAQEAARLLGLDNAGFRLLEGDELVVAGLAGTAAQTMLVTRIKIGESLAGQVVATGRRLVADLASTPAMMPEHLAANRRFGYTTFLGVPLRVGGRTIGVLTFRARRPFTARDQELAEAFAAQAAIAIEHSRLYAEATRRRQEGEELARLARTLAESLDVSAVLDKIAESVLPLFGARSSVLRLLQPDGSLLAVARSGRSREYFAPGHVLPAGVGTVGRAVAEGRPVTTADILNDPAFPLPDRLRDELAAAGHGAMLAVPLRVKGRLIGALGIADQAGRVFSADEVALLEAFADQAALALENARLYEATEVRAERLDTLARLNHLVTSSLDTGEVLTAIARAAGQIMKAPFVAFWGADEAAGVLTIRALSDEAAGAETRVLRLAFGEGLVGWVAKHRQPLNVPDVFADDRFATTDWARRHGFRSFHGLPLIDQESLLGVLVLMAEQPLRFSPDDESLVRSFSAQATVAIRNARLYEDARRYAERLRALDEVNRLVSSSLNPEEVVQNLGRAVAQFFDAAYASLWVYDPATHRLRRVVGFGDTGLAEELRKEVAPGEGAVGWVVAHREPILWTDVSQDERVLDVDLLVRRGLRWLAAYPIAIGDRAVGALAVHRTSPWPVTPETASLMGSLAAQAAIALENARLYSETTRRLAETRALLEVAEILNSTLDSRQLLKSVAIKVAQVCGVDRCSLELWDGDRVIPLMAQFADGRRVPELWSAFLSMPPYTPGEVPAHARAIATRRPVVIDDAAQADVIPREWVERYGIKSYMVVPLIRQDRVIGVMNLDYCQRPTPFQAWQTDLALAIAGQVALSLENSRLYAEVQDRLRETTTLLAVGRALSLPGPADEVMPRLAAEIGRAFGAHMVGVYFLDERREALIPIGGYHVPKPLLVQFQRSPMVLERFRWLQTAWREGRAVWSDDVLNDPRFDPDWKRWLPPLSVLFAPTMVHGAPIGGLFLVWWRTGRVFPPAEIRLLEGAAAQVGLAMENAELARQTQVKLEETATLLSVSRALSSTLDPQALARHFLRSVARTVGADSVGAWLVSADGAWLEPLAGYKVPRERLESLRAVRISLREHPFYAEAARHRRPVFSPDAAHDPRIPRHLFDAAPHRSQVFVPVVAKDRMIAGFAAVWWDREREFAAGDLAMMEAIANQAGVAIENARLFEENRRRVEELSVLHELSQAVTGQLDRAALIEAIRSQVGRVLEAGHMLIVLRDDERGEVEVALRVTAGAPDMRPPLRYPGGGVGLMSVVLDTGRAIRTDDYVAECARRSVEAVPASIDFPHWLGVPMAAGDRVLGVLVLRSSARAFTASDERLLLNIAHLAALALSSARLFEDRSRAYAELAATQDQLVRTEKLRALGEMASGVAHDFNNLLASVLGRAQLLLRRVQDPQLRQWLQVIERSAMDGAQTVRRLQEFTRVRRDQPLLPLDLNQVVLDALELTQSRWREEPRSRGISIEVRTSLGELRPIVGAAAELREAMTNLILNAVDAMPRGGALTLTTVDTGDRIEVSVGDTGVGMAAAVRERIFDPFFTTKGPQGTGLGLSMTYGIVARHAGAITVDSQEGRGSTFRLAFPPAPTVGPGAGPAPAGPPASRALRCLVVDDEEPVRTVLGDVLEPAGHRVVAVADGAEAIDRFRAGGFDVVLTDLAMPRISGWQVARAIKQIAPRVPVVLVTGFGVELTERERKAHGVDAVLVKPLQIQEILDAVAEVGRRLEPTHGPEGA